MSEPYEREFDALRRAVAATRWVACTIQRRQLDADGAPTSAWETVSPPGLTGREMLPRGNSNPHMSGGAGTVDYQSQFDRTLELPPATDVRSGDQILLGNNTYAVIELGGQSSHAIGMTAACQQIFAGE